MTTAKVFAPGFERDEQGRIKFPRDHKLRTDLLGKELNLHPAKNNIYLYQALAEYLTKPGEVIMDIMAGAGSVLALCSRNKVIGIELSPTFYQRLEAAVDQYGLRSSGEEWYEPLLLQGDCREILPLPCKCIIFSPPYAKSATGKSMTGEGEIGMEGIEDFTEGGKKNLGMMNDFLYSRRMKQVYELCYQSVEPSGYCVVIIRDRFRGGLRVEFSSQAIRFLQEAGFELWEWYQQYVPGSSRAIYNKQQGYKVAEEEDIIICRRP